MEANNTLTPRSERPSRSSSLHHSFPLETPKPKGLSPVSAGYATRKRSRVSTMGFDGAADESPAGKGGHTLRKRNRVDYTQELVDDDFSAHELKMDENKKPLTTTTGLGRKRRATLDLSGDDTDNASVAQKRRRLQKQPTRARSTSLRRKNQSTPRSTPTTVQPSVEHPSSDNDVQDTILVGGSMLVEDAQSESSLSSQGDGQDGPCPPVIGQHMQQTSTTAFGIDRPLLAAQNSPTPASENQTLTEEKASIGTTVTSMKIENEEPHLKDIKDFTPPTITTPIEENGDGVEIQLPAQLAQTSTDAHVATISGHREGSPGLSTSVQQSQPSASHPHDGEVTDLGGLNSGNTKDMVDDALISKNEMAEESSLAEASTPAEPPQPHVPQPKRLPQLDPIYSSAAQSLSGSQLAPYEDEAVILPASWTEEVYPQVIQETGIATPAPTITPRTTPPPKEPVHIPNTWNPLTKLPPKQFFAMYKEELSRRRAKGQGSVSMWEYQRAVERRRSEARKSLPLKPEIKVATKAMKGKTKAKGRGKAKTKRNQTPASSVEAESPALSGIQLSQTVAEPNDETPQASPVPESQPATAAPSPEPEAEPEAENPEDFDQDVTAEIIGAETENGPIEPEVVTKHPKKQYSFKKLTDISAFEEALDDPEALDSEVLYQRCAQSAKTLQAWQDEYLELKKITDDEDNAKRRAQNDKAIENWDLRQKVDDIPSWRRAFDDIILKIPALFDVKGVRAIKPYVDDPRQEDQRREDSIMAQAYGFEHKPEKSMIGKQDPIGQRFETTENRLRDRRQTQKAADAIEEGVIVEGKRQRKPRVLDDHSDPLSRATTPVPVPEPVIKKRGPRIKAKAAASQEEIPRPDHGQRVIPEPVTQQEQSKATRKRARPTAPHPLAITTYAEPEEEVAPNEDLEPPTKKHRKTKASYNDTEIPAGSFYSQSTADNPRRPSTSSSSGTANTTGTVESSYSLREKKKRNFAAENDPAAESRPKRIKNNPTINEYKTRDEAEVAELPIKPKIKRVRVRKREPVSTDNSLPATPVLSAAALPHASPVPAPRAMMHTFSVHPEPAPAPAKKAPLKIKLVNGHNHTTAAAAPPLAAAPVPSQPPSRAPSAAPTTATADSPAGAPGSSGGSAEPEKPYSEMSKSEKMSYSMRRRWAKGEMQGAVEKRKNTLARKAEAKATAPPPDLTPKPLQPAAGPPPPPSLQPQQVFYQDHYLPPPGPPPMM